MKKPTKEIPVPKFREELELKKDDIIPQRGMQQDVLTSDSDIIICGGSRGGGKAQPYDAKVLTPFGFRKMGHLKVGDQIMNPNGRGQFIIQIHEQGYQDVYEMEFIDGAKTQCTLDHLWQIRKTCQIPKVRVTEFFGEEPFFEGKVWTTKMIIDFFDKKEAAEENQTIKIQNLLTPLCKPMTFQKSSVNKCNLHPYLIGVLLGDGTITARTNVLYTSLDPEIADKLASLGYENRLMNDGKTVKFSEKNNIADELEKVKLLGTYSHNKFIPEYLKFGTIEERFQVLQGLMDTDGTCDDRGHPSFCSTSKQLAKDVQFIISSLGGRLQ